MNNACPELPDFFYPMQECDLDQWDMAIDTQARAFLIGVQEAARLIPDGGRTGSLQPWARMGAAKSAMELLVRYFAVALAKRDITMNAISPG